jgi:hypothetical protein
MAHEYCIGPRIEPLLPALGSFDAGLPPMLLLPPPLNILAGFDFGPAPDAIPADLARSADEELYQQLANLFEGLKNWRQEVIVSIDGLELGRAVVTFFDEDPGDLETWLYRCGLGQFGNAPERSPAGEDWSSVRNAWANAQDQTAVSPKIATAPIGYAPQQVGDEGGGSATVNSEGPTVSSRVDPNAVLPERVKTYEDGSGEIQRFNLDGSIAETTTWAVSSDWGPEQITVAAVRPVEDESAGIDLSFHLNSPVFSHHSLSELRPIDEHPSTVSPTKQAVISALAAIHLTDTGAFPVVEFGLGFGTLQDAGPGQVLHEFATGTGPDERVFGPSSPFSQRFAEAPTTKAIQDKALQYWYSRDGGIDGVPKNPTKDITPGLLTDFPGPFTPWSAAKDLNIGILPPSTSVNGPAEIIGTFTLEAAVDGAVIHWQATNDMGLDSFGGGNLIGKNLGFEPLPNIDRPLPYGTTRQIIQWDTTLSGALIKPNG